MDDWNLCIGKQNTTGKFVGVLDLSIVDDWSAYGKNYKVGNKYHTQTKYFLPEHDLKAREKRMGIVLQPWVDEGWIILTPGKTVNHDFIFHYIQKDIASGNMEAFCYDPWKARRIVKKIKKLGYEDTLPIRQGFMTLSEPTKMLSDLIIEHRIVDEGNPVTALHMSNLTIVTDAGDNMKPNKGDREAKIDGAAAHINGLAYYVHSEEEPKQESIYEERGLRTL
jgi:phage terminase large subunit-like protein